jgi:uncharacterized protein
MIKVKKLIYVLLLLGIAATIGYSQETASEYVSPSEAVPRGKAPKMQVQLLNPGEPTKQYAVIFYQGDEAFSGLAEFAEKYYVTSAHFTAIGALNRATLGWFDPQRKMYKKIPINGQHEVIGMSGNIALHQGKPVVHTHMVVGSPDGTTRVGHVLDAYVGLRSIVPRLEVHARQVLRAEVTNESSEIVGRLYADAFSTSFEQSNQGIHSAQGARIPFIDPDLEDFAVACIILGRRFGQGLTPLAVPAAIFVQRVEDLAKQVVLLSECKIAGVFQKQLVDHRLEHEIQCNESLAPIVGDQQALHKLAQRLPARVVFPERFAVRREARKSYLDLANAVGQAFHAASLVARLECCGHCDAPTRRHLCDICGNHHEGMAGIA